MKIGLLGHDFVNWGGGMDFLRLVVDSLLSHPKAGQSEFHLLIPDSGLRLKWRHARGRMKHALRSAISNDAPPPGTILPPEIIQNFFLEFSRQIKIHHIGVGRGALARAARRLKLDAVLPAVHTLGSEFCPPWIGYAYDFQHKYLPENFSKEDCSSRDEHFSDLFTQSRAVIVNSQTTAADAAKFVPEKTARIFVLPFAPAPSLDWKESRPEVLPKYGITAPFFLISNQFWAHKEHLTAFEAFRAVAAEHPQVQLVCTGSAVGARDPNHYPRLLEALQKWDLGSRVRMLGLIPKLDQIELMKNSLAVIQPTLFEGDAGGGSVYDAVSLDVPAIVSDLPVNREVEAADVVFFPVRNAAALALKMQERLDMSPRKRATWDELAALGRRRRAACGIVLWDALAFAVHKEQSESGLFMAG